MSPRDRYAGLTGAQAVAAHTDYLRSLGMPVGEPCPLSFRLCVEGAELRAICEQLMAEGTTVAQLLAAFRRQAAEALDAAAADPNVAFVPRAEHVAGLLSEVEAWAERRTHDAELADFERRVGERR